MTVDTLDPKAKPASDTLSQVWQHKKTGGLYVIIAEDSLIEADLTPAVIYKSLSNGQIWVRPVSEFHDGRFQRLDQSALEQSDTSEKPRGGFLQRILSGKS